MCIIEKRWFKSINILIWTSQSVILFFVDPDDATLRKSGSLIEIQLVPLQVTCPPTSYLSPYKLKLFLRDKPVLASVDSSYNKQQFQGFHLYVIDAVCVTKIFILLVLSHSHGHRRNCLSQKSL